MNQIAMLNIFNFQVKAVITLVMNQSVWLFYLIFYVKF